MTSTAAGERHPSSMPDFLAKVPLIAWCAIGVAVFAAGAFWFGLANLTSTLGDTDDATRMIEVRELLAGRSWFDMTLPRFGGASPLVSHWSRLIDLPIAAMLSLYELFLSPEHAELATRATWPLVLLLAFLYLLAREVENRNGHKAAIITIVIALTCTGIVQFLPGRIDHHGAIITCAVIGLLQLGRSFDTPRVGWSAGFFLGLGNAIGYEALTLTAPLLGVAALYGIAPRRSLLGPANAAVAFAATLAIALAVTTSPSNLLVSHCDALSINIVALAAIAAIGVCVVQNFEQRLSLVAKLTILAATGTVGIAAYLGAEPACVAGPFSQVNPDAIAIWLDYVSETRTVASLPPQAAAVAFVYYAVGFYCGARLRQSDGSEALRFHMLILAIAVPLSFWQIKLLPYALFLTAPLLGAFLGSKQPASHQSLSAQTKAMYAAALLLFVGGTAWIVMGLTSQQSDAAKAHAQVRDDCLSTASITPLEGLPAGLAVADVNLGPYLINLTHLDSLSAPYHRLGNAIVEGHRIFYAPPAEAEQRLRKIGARYVIACTGLASTQPQTKVPADALQTLLLANKAPSFLEPVTLPTPTPIKVWQLKP